MNHYRPLFIMLVLSFVAMYALMFAMADSTTNIYNSLNQFYMAALMASPMALLEIAVMSAMYKDKRLNAIIAAASVFVLVASFAFIRQQTAIGDKQFLRSMIPHHASAILMCEQASITDAKIRELCRGIISGQQAAIDQMKGILRELDASR